MITVELMSDLLNAVAVIAATLLVGRGAWKVASLFLDSGPCEVLSNSSKEPQALNAGRRVEVCVSSYESCAAPVAIAAMLLLAWAAIVLGAFTLNLVGILYPGPLLATMVLTGMLVQRLCRDCPRRDVFSGQIDLLLIGSMSLVVAQVFMFGLMVLPADWDTLAYHLPLVDHWIQSGNLADTSTAFWYVPGNLELLGYYFSGALSGDFWAQFANVPVVALLAAAAAALCRELGLEKRAARWVCFGVVINPVVLRQVHTLENDVAVGALFLVATLFGARAIRSGRLGELALCGIAVGLLAGVKYYAVGYAFVVASSTTLLGTVRYGSRYGCRALTIFFLGVVALSAFWYVRNFQISGAPMYPKGIPFLGIVGPWDELRPGFAKTCLALGFTAADGPLLALAWAASGGILLPLSLLLGLVIGIPRILFCLAGLVRRQGGSVLRVDSSDPSGEIGVIEESVIDGPNNYVYAELAILLCMLGGAAVYSVTPNVLETDLGSRNMLKLQYHPVRFGFSAALLATITVTGLVSRIIRDASPPGIGAAQKVATRSVQNSSPVFSGDSATRRYFGGQKVLWMFHEVALPVLALASATISLLPQYGWRREFRENGLIVWWPSHLDYDPYALLLGTLDIGVVLYIMSTCLSSARKWLRLVPLSSIAFAIVASTPFLSTAWHQNFDDHFASIRSISLRPPMGRAISGRKTVVCDYRYYATLGSRRQNDVDRPLFVGNHATFQEFLRSREAEVVVTLRSDNHWSRSYVICYDFLTSLESGFVMTGSSDRYAIFEKRPNPNVSGKGGMLTDSKFR